MFGLGSTELLIIVLAVFVLFGGGKKIPELFSGIGKGVRSFRKSLSGEDEEERTDTKKEQIDNTPKT